MRESRLETMTPQNKTEFQAPPAQFTTEKLMKHINTNTFRMRTLTTSIANVITFILAENLMKICLYDGFAQGE